MDKFGITATIYDFLGYFIPGFALWGLVLGAWYHSCPTLPLWAKIQSLITSAFMQVQPKDLSINWFSFVFIIFVLYVTGHIVSTLSSLVIEKLAIMKLGWGKNAILVKGAISTEFYGTFTQKFEERFHFKFDDDEFRACIAFVQTNRPSVYTTAFVFLTFYGMARNILLSVIIVLPWEIINGIVSFSGFQMGYIGILLAGGTVFCLEYVKFIQCFKKEIVSGFMVEKEKENK
jgi:hypothetical protein